MSPAEITQQLGLQSLTRRPWVSCTSPLVSPDASLTLRSTSNPPAPPPEMVCTKVWSGSPKPCGRSTATKLRPPNCDEWKEIPGLLTGSWEMMDGEHGGPAKDTLRVGEKKGFLAPFGGCLYVLLTALTFLHAISFYFSSLRPGVDPKRITLCVPFKNPPISLFYFIFLCV